jgi:hypothetical protein
MTLSVRENEQIRRETEAVVRARLESRRPDVAQFVVEENRAARFIANTMVWSKAIVPVIAVLAAVASSVRTMQTASEIYAAAGTGWLGVLVAAITFTISAEVALFLGALAQENERMKYRAEKRERHVFNLADLIRSIGVRLGLARPRRYDELPEGGSLGVVMFTAFSFAVAANFYMGLRPLLYQLAEQGQETNIQTFLANLWTAPASLQMQFIVDLAAVFFPPMMALSAGHLTARFAAEVAERQQRSRYAYERALDMWRKSYEQPLETPEGRELLEARLQEKLEIKRLRSSVPQVSAVSSVSSVPVERPVDAVEVSRVRDDNAPERARKLLQDNPEWKPADLIRAGISKSTAYKVFNETKV